MPEIASSLVWHHRSYFASLLLSGGLLCFTVRDDASSNGSIDDDVYLCPYCSIGNSLQIRTILSLSTGDLY